MAQHDYVIANQGFPAFRSDLNDALAAIVSNNSGATEPTTMFAHQMWVDTAANPSVLKIRNADNDAWITVGVLDQTGDTFILRPAAGSATVPAYSTTSDTNTGVYFPGADRVGITTGGTQRVEVDASGNVGVNTASMEARLQVHQQADGEQAIRIAHNARATGKGHYFSLSGVNNDSLVQYYDDGSTNTLVNLSGNALHQWHISGTQAMTLDASGNLLVGKTSANATLAGIQLEAGGDAYFTAEGSQSRVIYANRLTSDGTIVELAKAGTTVGSIGSLTDHLYIGKGDTGLRFIDSLDSIEPFDVGTPGARDNAIDLGRSGVRFDDIYATNGTIQTSDANEKQDIESLSEAETRVAVAAKGLLKKYRWKSAVAEKGDDARIHFGIIAQDLKAAFEAEGLDAGRYAMFIHSEWWETQTEVPAVEAQEAVYETQTDEEGNETQVLVSEAVEGKDAYIRTDTYQTEAEAPEGAVRKERMGIRYNELLAFIIAAI